MYLTYNELTPAQQTTLVNYQTETEGVEPWEVLDAWYEVDGDEIYLAMETEH